MGIPLQPDRSCTAKWRISIAAVATVSVLLGIACGGQQHQQAQPTDTNQAIQLEGVQLSLGMPQEDVLRKLAVVCDVNHVADVAGNWSVTRRGVPRSRRDVGIVVFGGGKLSFVSKNWGPEFDNQTARAVSMSLHNAVEAVVGEGARPCNVSVETAGKGHKTVISCGPHRIEVFAPSDSEYTATVREVLHRGR